MKKHLSDEVIYIETTRFLMALVTVVTGILVGVEYEAVTMTVGSKPEAVYSLTVDMSDPNIEVSNGLSFGQLYGFETLSDMVAREEAVYGVNGMFYDALGLPYGTMVHDGVPIRLNNIGTPVLLIGKNNEVALRECQMSMSVRTGEGEVLSVRVNDRVPDNTWTLFQPVYGKTTRVYRHSTNYRITDEKVTEVIVSDGPVKLKGSDYVLTYAGDDATFKVGDAVGLLFDDQMDDFEVEEAFQTGGWLVRDGENIAKADEPFMGPTTAPQPRTLVGITSEHKLIFLVIDGRQKGYSLGLSGWEAAEMLLGYGCVDGGYLDGGASSTMWAQGRIVNRPSGGEERALAHCILIGERKLR